MLLYALIIIISSNAVANNVNKSISYSRIATSALFSFALVIFYNFFAKSFSGNIGLFNGLFNINILNLSFTFFIFIIAIGISILTAFYPRKIYYLENKMSLLSNTRVKDENRISYSDVSLNKNQKQFTIIEYSLITIFILTGAVLLMCVGDLTSLFLSIELQSYGLYILTAIYRDSESSTNSSLIYFLLGGLSSCFILLGSAILYVNSGVTSLDNLYILNSISEYISFNDKNFVFNLIENNLSGIYTNNNDMSNYINFSLIILTVGLLFKISAAPFHFWSPDVYDGIPTIVTTFVATISKISLLALMLELISSFDVNTLNLNETTSLNYEWKNILILSSLMSLVIGSLLGLSQHRIKRLFAYSTISHVGFILLALSINKIESIQGYIFYIFQYSICNLNAFFILITIGYVLYQHIYKATEENQKTNKSNSLDNKKIDESENTKPYKYIDIDNSPIQFLNQIKGFFYINSYLSISFAITLFSFIGIPPLIGFFAKQMVLSAALDQGYIFMTLVGVITSVIGAGYYLNIIKLIFFSKSDYIKYGNELDQGSYDKESNNRYVVLINDKLSLVISVLTMLIILFILMPDEWFNIVIILSLSK